MTVEELFIALGFKTDTASQKQVQSDASGLKNTLTKLLGAIGIGFTVTGIKNFIQESASYAADLKATNTQFNQTFGDMAETAEESLKKVSQSTGIAETRMKAAYSRMASFAKTGGMSSAEANDFTARSMEALADNAAYMDKTIEETQDTFQRLLKGNFQLDDNLNFNLSEAERNEMAMSMFQKKTYSDLTENEKKELILQKLISANKQMGAEGQASREADEYTNQVGELSDVIKQLKANIGMVFLPQVLTITQKLAAFLQKVTDKLGDAEDETSLLYKITQKVTNIVNKFVSGLGKLYRVAKNVVDALGGFENSLRILAVVAGVAMAVLAADTLSGLIKNFNIANIKIWLLIAAFTVLALLVQDFIYFMSGKKSEIGKLLDDNGIDQDKVRSKIKDVEDGVLQLADTVKTTFEGIATAIADATTNLAEFLGFEDKADMFGAAWDTVKSVFKGIYDILKLGIGALEQFIGLEYLLGGDRNIATRQGTMRMTKEDAHEYLQAKHDSHDQSKADEAEEIMTRLEEKYKDVDTTSAGQKMMIEGSDNFVKNMGNLDGLNSTSGAVEHNTWSDAMSSLGDVFKSIANDLTGGVFYDKLYPPISEASDSTKESAEEQADAADSSASDAKDAKDATTTAAETAVQNLNDMKLAIDDFSNTGTTAMDAFKTATSNLNIVQNNSNSFTLNGSTATEKTVNVLQSTTKDNTAQLAAATNVGR
jgi:hypothetical protein